MDAWVGDVYTAMSRFIDHDVLFYVILPLLGRKCERCGKISRDESVSPSSCYKSIEEGSMQGNPVTDVIFEYKDVCLVCWMAEDEIEQMIRCDFKHIGHGDESRVYLVWNDSRVSSRGWLLLQ